MKRCGVGDGGWGYAVCAMCAMCCVCSVCGVRGVGGVGGVGCAGGVCVVCAVSVDCNLSAVGCEMVGFLFVGLVLCFAVWRGFGALFLSLEGFGTLMCCLGVRCFWQGKFFKL